MQRATQTSKINTATLAQISEDDSTRVGDWISTYSGGRWFPLDPRVEEVNIVDIAHSLSMLCRYNGHSHVFYSVAEHCWLLSYIVPDQFRLEALLHDASESYTSDIPRPFKYSEDMTGFRRVEEANTRVVYEFAGLSFPESSIVKKYDSMIVANEAEVLLPNSSWHRELEKIPNVKIVGYDPTVMKKLYLDRYYELTA